MATVTTNDEAAILSRVIMPDDGDMPLETAKAILRLKFSPKDIARMHELTVRNQGGDLTLAEEKEIASYRHVGHFLDLMHSKARRSLKKQNGES
ncbi:MAG TPA: hypothetical protein VGX78_11640 [Pirellulales bacterium]|jgi:hypothetical protein|nr:hypothetical protein [Pirellulales bacterium]